jgi:hypothetical protein
MKVASLKHNTIAGLMFSKNPIFVVFLVLAAISAMKMVYQGESKIEQMERISRICASLPQPHPDCNVH